ncbi:MULTISPECIES: H-NS family nucleoid-associated regulatory protein [Neptunomonas]|uniref:DNA-binding protein n=1 Tax=Neptunomonas qingdaonensis TaxID=1045558 RepID=A0A1I2MPJ1_9GAMM|nr:H-NS histone family protein [Neptunomonas qingdaonensis]SFF93414.1 DNA-binding protein H-NS/DNA-binding protein StpA [Neptunomonas qingdaonensis]
MTDIVKILTRKNSLRKQCQDLSITDIEKIIIDLTDILKEKEVSELERIEADREKNAKIDMIRKTMQEAGIGFEDIKDLVVTTTKKKVEAKYRIIDADGETHEWSGRGRTPLAFQEYFDKHGVTKDACLIK